MTEVCPPGTVPGTVPGLRGPSVWRLLRDLRKIRNTPLEYLLDAHRKYGDVIPVWLGVPALILSGPADIRHVLIDSPEKYLKTGALVMGRKFFGEGLFTSEGEVHARKRRIVLPMMHKSRIARYAQVMAEAAATEADRWPDGEAIDLPAAMTHMTLNVIGRTLLGVDLSNETEELSAGVTAILEYLTYVVSTPIRLPAWPINARYRAYCSAIARLDALVARLITARRNKTGDDLLSLLLAATDEQGTPLTDNEIRDEIMTLFAAGHETTANALVWTWQLLGANPGAREKFHAEIDAASLPADLQRLTYTQMVFNESLRLYPPVWEIARSARENDLLPSGVAVEKGMQVLIFPWVAHRNPRHFEEPARFIPERFADGDKAGEFVFLPFSAGPRGCIGEQFARMEALIALAVIGRTFALEPAPGGIPRPKPLLTLRPPDRFTMIARRRNVGR